MENRNERIPFIRVDLIRDAFDEPQTVQAARQAEVDKVMDDLEMESRITSALKIIIAKCPKNVARGYRTGGRVYRAIA
jgi:hypothetical protein